MDDTTIYASAHNKPLPVDHEYSWRKARWAPQACMGWRWAAACGVQGRGHIARLPAQLVSN